MLKLEKDKSYTEAGLPKLCRDCISFYKQNGILIHGKPHPQCKGIYPAEVPEGIDEEEANFLISMEDPTSFISLDTNGEYTPRWYQSQILRCTSQFKVLRLGRRAGKTHVLAADGLIHASQGSGRRVLIVCPYENQVRRIFEEMQKVIDASTLLKSSIRGIMKNPWRVEFDNSSIIIGHTAGARSGRPSEKIRGEDATKIILDEGDYLSQKDYEVLMAILASHPECELTVSSTPTGRVGHFMTFCKQKSLGFKETHHTSHVSPSWTKEAESLFLATYSRTAYEHEIMAEFGEPEDNVFPKRFVDDMFSYDYRLPFKHENAIYGIGVDWNGKGIGVHIVTVAFIPREPYGYFQLADVKIIDRDEFTQSYGVEAIAEASLEWNPEFIYLDRGYGEFQWEMLRKIGMQHPKTRLHRIVKAIDMGGKTEIVDPFTMKKEKKHTKPLMVNMLLKQVEEGRMVAPKGLDVTVSVDMEEGVAGQVNNPLGQQIREYAVKRYTPDGRPIYEDENAHTLTGLFLAVYGFQMEMSDFVRRPVGKQFAYVPLKEISSVRSPDENEEEFVEDRDLNIRVKPPTSVMRPRWVDPARNNISVINRRSSPQIPVNWQRAVMGRTAPGRKSF